MNTNVDVIAAVTASEPNCAYSRFLAEDAMTWSEQHKVWIAARGADVEAVLNDPACCVRPTSEPVPALLRGTSVGDVFARLVRMNEGETHARLKRAVEKALDAQDAERVRATSRRHAEDLATQGDLDRFIVDVPVFSVASLLGIADEHLPEVAACMGGFVRAIAPGASDDDIAHGNTAADRLILVFDEMMASPPPDSLFRALKDAFVDEGIDDPDAIVANAIGFLFQTHDAMAGLIGNTIVHLARHPDAIDATAPLRSQVELIAYDVAHVDAAVHNTRRFVAEDTVINGMRVKQGDVVLVSLAAANMDNTDRSWSFGGGRHACPSQSVALTIAAEGVLALVRGGVIPEKLPEDMRYQPLTNVRISVFAETSCKVRVP